MQCRTTALIVAAKGGHLECVSLLLAKGADANRVNTVSVSVSAVGFYCGLCHGCEGLTNAVIRVHMTLGSTA